MDSPKLDNYINIACKVFAKVLNVNITGWDYVKVDDKDSFLAKTYMCSYDEKRGSIFINPYIIDIMKEKGLPDKYLIPALFAKVAHEFRHCWQKKNSKFKEDYGKKTLANDGLKYIHQPHEIDAYAFEEAVLKILFNDINHELDIPEEKVHEESIKLYNEYKMSIESELKAL